jgi:hypothetical protein
MIFDTKWWMNSERTARFLADCQSLASGSRDEAAKERIRAATQGFMIQNADAARSQMQAELMGTVQEQARARAAIQAMTAKIQADHGITKTSDLPIILADQFNVTIAKKIYDLNYELAFQQVPVADGQNFWEIDTVDNALTFRKVAEGGRVQMQGFTGSQVFAFVDYFGGALGWTDAMIRFRQLARMVEMANFFTWSFWKNKADYHYALLAAAGLLNIVAYNDPTGIGACLANDILTMNAAVFQIANTCRNKGYGDTANAQYILYANPADKPRITAALNAQSNYMQMLGWFGTEIGYNIQPIWTFNEHITAGFPLIVLPGHKLQRADVMQPTTYQAIKDPYTLNEAASCWAIYGSAVADTDQVAMVTLE